MNIKQAFTLIELLVVIAIIGILSGLIVVSMNGITQKATIAKAQVFSSSLKNSLMMNLIGQWTFDDITDYNSTTKILNSTTGNIPDSWGNNEGRAYGGPTLSTSCVSGSCLYFDGVDDIMNISSNVIDNLSAITVEAWVNGQQQANLIKANGNAVLLHFRGAGFYLVASDSTASGYLLWDKAPSLNNWNHVIATWDGATMSTYLNGKKQNTTLSFAGGVNKKLISIVSLDIGGYFNEFQPYFKGSIDDVRIYKAAMPISEIQEQYYAGLNSLYIGGNISLAEYQSRLLTITKK